MFINIFKFSIKKKVTPFNYTNKDVSVFGAIGVTAGIFGTITMAINTDKTKKYKRNILLCTFLTMFSLGICFLVLYL